MYSGGWEVVGKNKKEKPFKKTGKLTKVEKQKFIENAPRVEDFRKFCCIYLCLSKFIH